MARRALKKESPILAEQRRLVEAQKEILEKQERLQQLVSKAPTLIKQQRRRQREAIKLHLHSATRPAAPGIAVGDKWQRLRQASPAPSGSRLRRSERNAARIKFLILCIILLTIFLWLWQSLPN